MIIDKKGRLFGKLNIIDLLVVIFIAAAICITCFKFASSSEKGVTETNASIEYTIKVSAVRDFTVRQFKEGESLYDNETGKYIGKISAVKAEDSMDYVLKSDGTYSYAKRPERSDVIITVETKGLINGSGYFAEGIRQISPHSTIIISNNRLKTTGVVQSVRKLE